MFSNIDEFVKLIILIVLFLLINCVFILYFNSSVFTCYILSVLVLPCCLYGKKTRKKKKKKQRQQYLADFLCFNFYT